MGVPEPEPRCRLGSSTRGPGEDLLLGFQLQVAAALPSASGHIAFFPVQVPVPSLCSAFGARLGDPGLPFSASSV